MLTQQIHPPGLHYQPQPLRCTHHFQRRGRGRERERERERDQRRPLPQSPADEQVPTAKLLNPKDVYNPYPSHSSSIQYFRSFTELSTIERAIVITADRYTPNRLSYIVMIYVIVDEVQWGYIPYFNGCK
jgi:hypothetical protein